MPRESPPTLNLEQVQVLTQSENPAYETCHIFGILAKETTNLAGTTWHLFDEIKDIYIKLCGSIAEYPRPKPGDVVRVHRLRINRRTLVAEIVVPKNVVVWPAFQHEPMPTTLARNPTITDDDNLRRRVLESFYCSKIERIKDILSTRTPGQNCSIVAGRIDDINLDTFQHLEFVFTDGTGRLRLRVFRKINANEDDHHFKVASEMQRGQFFVAANVKYDNKQRVNLSANLAYGRSLRKVEPSSILGTKLKESLPNQQETQHDNIASSQGSRRRSPRLLKQNHDENITNINPAQTPIGTQQSAETLLESTINQSTRNTNNESSSVPTSEQYPKFTFYSDIKPKSHGYNFYDIIGQVREKPFILPQFNNCALQIYDGSPHNHSSFYADQVGQVVDGCLVLLVYSKQKETDTDEHVEKAKKLTEGDIMLIKNVKVSFILGKIKLELSANKAHDKSINVIDKSTSFGRRVLDIVETPQVQELREMIDPITDHYDGC